MARALTDWSSSPSEMKPIAPGCGGGLHAGRRADLLAAHDLILDHRAGAGASLAGEQVDGGITAANSLPVGDPAIEDAFCLINRQPCYPVRWVYDDNHPVHGDQGSFDRGLLLSSQHPGNSTDICSTGLDLPDARNGGPADNTDFDLRLKLLKGVRQLRRESLR
jgi:hypothetical protein